MHILNEYSIKYSIFFVVFTITITINQIIEKSEQSFGYK